MNNDEELDQYDYINNEDYPDAVKKYSEVLGKFFMEFSLLEHELNTSIAEIINDASHDIGYQVMEQMKMGNKIDLFYRLYNSMLSYSNEIKSKKIKRKERLNNIKSSLGIINDFRNQLAHANRQTIQKNGLVRTRFSSDKISGQIKLKNIQIKPNDIRIKINEINKIANKLRNYKETAFQV
ncbi:MAG: hypothetical protein NTX91_02545 [candidate division SR1 bacterium]|nr:hypothetical protein [candidate division SR1 bacterium]